MRAAWPVRRRFSNIHNFRKRQHPEIYLRVASSYLFAQFPYVARPFAPPVLPLTDTPLGGMVTEPLASAEPDGQKRRSTRIVQAVPITVTGVDALGQPFKERTTTVMVNCHGCKYQSKHYVPKNSMVTLEVPRPEAGQKRTTQGRVVWVQRPRTVRELFQIGLEFEVPGNVWGIAFPPNDWTPVPGETSASGHEGGGEHREYS